jgi:hypothetical protein
VVNDAGFHHSRPQHGAQQLEHRLVTHPFLDCCHQPVMRNRRKTVGDIRFHHPPPTPPGLVHENLQGVVLAPFRAEPETARGEVRFQDRLKHDLECGLHNAVAHRRDGCFILPLLQSWVGMFSSVMELR